jgi:hypothetical protein
MHNTASFATLAAKRLLDIQEQRSKEQEAPNQKEQIQNNNNSIELPEAIKKLNTGSDEWVEKKANRYKRLIQEGHLNDLLELAKLAPKMATKAHPSHWFATAAGVKEWKRTLNFLKKVYAARHKAQQVAERIGTAVNKFIFKQIWAHRSVERHAATVQELPHNKPNQSKAKLFTWLCQQEGREQLARA